MNFDEGVGEIVQVVRSRVIPQLPKNIVNLPHDPLGPLNTRVDQFVTPWAALGSTEQVIGGLHVQ
jgi:hypothetical protein